MSQVSVFAAALAEALQNSAKPIAGRPAANWTSSGRSRGNDFAQLSAALTLSIRFSGELEGELFLCPDEAASQQMFSEIDPRDRNGLAAKWQELFQTCGQGLAAALRVAFGNVEVRGCRTSELGVDAAPLADLACGGGGEISGTMFILGDAAFCETLMRAELAPEAAVALSPGTGTQDAPLSRVIDVPLSVTLRFGQRQMTLRELLELNTGSLVELDQQVEEPVHLMLGERVIARGEVVIVDGNYGMRVLEVIEHPMQRVATLTNS